MALSRSERSEIYSKIADCLRVNGPLNINQISEKIESNWETVKNAIDSLEKAKFIGEENNKYFISCSMNGEFNEQTIFNLPLTKEQNELFCKIANRIKELSKETLKQTVLQKAVVEVIKKSKINNLPYGWYMYGECCVHTLKDTLGFGITKDYDKEIQSTLEEFSTHGEYVEDLLDYLYTKENNELYLLKLDTKLLLEQKITENNKSNLKTINRNLMRMLILLHKFNFSEKIIFQFDEFTSYFGRLKNLDPSAFENIRLEILNSFKYCWNLIAITNFKRDLEKFYIFELDPYTQPREETYLDLLEEEKLQLEEACPKIELSAKTEALRKKLLS
ncbi:MAG: hypothetical protein AB7V77_05990 [Candidatus Woesearchaeota archaeon]